MDQMPTAPPSTFRRLLLLCLTFVVLLAAGWALVLRERGGSGRLQPPANSSNEPVWQTYQDNRISFSYPKTFCGTSWAEEWDTEICDEPWRADLENADREPASALDAGPGMTVHIFPSYSSFGGEFGGDIHIDYLTEAAFNDAVALLGTSRETTLNGYLIWKRKDVEGYPDTIDEYYIQGDLTSIRITSSFPQQYPRYMDRLLSTLTLLPADDQWSLLTWNPGVSREEVERADWHDISVSRYDGLDLSSSFVEKRTPDCQAGAVDGSYLRVEGGMCRAGFWLEDSVTGQRIDSPEELWRAGVEPSERKAASYAAATLEDLQTKAGDVPRGKTAKLGADYLVQMVNKNTFGCTSHKPLRSIYRLSVNDDGSVSLTRVAYEKDPGPIVLCVD